MTITQSRRRVGQARLRTLLENLLDASTLCAIATVDRARAHVNTAYFARSVDFRLVWISDAGATHSQNLLRNPSAAVAVFDSRQVWGEPDRGVQLFGTARELTGRAADRARDVYSTRFADYEPEASGGFRCYELRPRRAKLFDEHELGSGVFVQARIGADGLVAWERTDVVRPS